MSSSSARQRYQAMLEARTRRQAEKRESLFKALFVVCGVPVATWLGTYNYYLGEYLDGELPSYAVASGLLLCVMLLLPLQVVTTALLVFLGRRLLRYTSWLMMLMSCVLAGIGARLFEGWAHPRDGAAGVFGEVRTWVDFCGPYVVGMAVLTMLAFSGLVAQSGVRVPDEPA